MTATIIPFPAPVPLESTDQSIERIMRAFVSSIERERASERCDETLPTVPSA